MFADIKICRDIDHYGQISKVIEKSKIKSISLDPLSGAMEEIAHGPALWMWDYLRRSGGRGFFIPLSGGADSANCAALVSSMAKLILESIQNGN